MNRISVVDLAPVRVSVNERAYPIFLGICASGANTDTVLFDESKEVLASAKALTIKHDLAVGMFNTLVGYPADALVLAGLGHALGGDAVVFISGGHTVTGSEQSPLDLETTHRLTS